MRTAQVMKVRTHVRTCNCHIDNKLRVRFLSIRLHRALSISIELNKTSTSNRVCSTYPGTRVRDLNVATWPSWSSRRRSSRKRKRAGKFSDSLSAARQLARAPA